jgi:mono/diheme cytochrome c family protein
MVRLLLLLIFTGVIACQGNPYTQGGYLYELKCSSCHMQDGSGLGANIPSLVNAGLFDDLERIVCVIYHGLEGVDPNNTSLAMPPNKSLTPTEVANVINYMQFEWKMDTDPVSESWVKNILQDCSSNDRQRPN